jgi:ribosome-associated protein
MLRISPQLSLPKSEFRFTFARASGPGGQNVNKVNTKAMLAWNLQASPSVPPTIKDRFRHKFGTKINNSGDLIITSQRFRDQARNIDDCLEKLRAMLASVERPPKRRIATKRTKSSKLRRLAAKKHKSSQKQLRRSPGSGE